MSSMLMTCNEERQVKDREWLLRLLIAGMRGSSHGDLCRLEISERSICQPQDALLWIGPSL